MNEIKKEKQKRTFARFMYQIFVHNIGYKIFAIVMGVLLWSLTVGL